MDADEIKKIPGVKTFAVGAVLVLVGQILFGVAALILLGTLIAIIL